jgi:hypothetical protein
VQAIIALPALWGIEGNDMITRFHTGDASADLYHYARTFMTENGGESAFRVVAG